MLGKSFAERENFAGKKRNRIKMCFELSKFLRQKKYWYKKWNSISWSCIQKFCLSYIPGLYCYVYRTIFYQDIVFTYLNNFSFSTEIIVNMWGITIENWLPIWVLLLKLYQGNGALIWLPMFFLHCYCEFLDNLKTVFVV